MVANKAQSGRFTKSVDIGEIAYSIVYTVPEGTYFAPTQDEANHLALEDVYNNGQDYANSHSITFVYNPLFDGNYGDLVIIPDPHYIRDLELIKAREIIYKYETGKLD